jgi:hypothetical protein
MYTMARLIQTLHSRRLSIGCPFPQNGSFMSIIFRRYCLGYIFLGGLSSAIPRGASVFLIVAGFCRWYGLV